MNLLSHDIQIGVYHTRNDFHLIPAKKPVVQPPSEKTVTLSVPGVNGSVDLSHSLTGYPVFNAREGSWEFYSDLDYNRVWTAYEEIKRKLILQCRNSVDVILDDDPTFLYRGKVWVSSKPTAANQQTKITMKYKFYPFKCLRKPLETDWLWDDFNFETDLAPQRLGDLVLSAAATEGTPVRLPPTDRPALLSLRAAGTAVNAVLRRNNASGAVLWQGSLAAGGANTDILLEPASAVNGSTPDIYYLTLTKAAGTEAHVYGAYHPDYL